MADYTTWPPLDQLTVPPTAEELSRPAPASDQEGSEGPPGGFAPDDPVRYPEPAPPPTTDEAYQGEAGEPPVGFEPPDIDGPPPPIIPPTDPAYQGPIAVTPPGFEPFPPPPGDPDSPVEPPTEVVPA